MITPLGHRLLIKPIEIEEKTEGGIWKPQQTTEMERAGVDKGTVVAIGTTCWLDPSFGGKPWCKVGDKVVWARYAGKPVKDADGTEYHLLNDEDVLGRED